MVVWKIVVPFCTHINHKVFIMNKIVFFIVVLIVAACNSPQKNKIPCYAWLGGPGDATDTEILDNFKDLGL